MATIPLLVRDDPDDPGAAELYVDVELDGRSMRMLLDTGAGSSRILADEFTRAFAPAAPEPDRGRGVLGPSTSSSHRVLVPSLEIGPIRVEGLAVELAEPGTGRPSAILGLDVLRDHRIDVRVDAGSITFDADVSVDSVRPLLQSSRGHGMIDVHLPGMVVPGLWDTGAAASVVDSGLVEANPHLFSPLRTSVGIDVGGNSAETPLVTMAACVIGGREFPSSIAAVAPILGIQRPGDPDFAIIIGYPLIRHAHWAMDFKRATWGFLPEGQPASSIPNALATPAL